MKIEVNDFKGKIPKVSDRILPDTNATIALNTRLRSGDLEPYNDLLTQLTFDKGVSAAIYPIDREQNFGGPYWLNWTPAESTPVTHTVDVIRGPIPQDTQERTYFTGAIDDPTIVSPSSLTDYRPKVTTISKAITGVSGNRYPKAWLTLGIPPPVNPILIAQNLLEIGPTLIVLNDGTSTSGYTLSSQDANRIITISSTTGVVGIATGIQLENKTGAASATYIYRDAAVGTLGLSNFEAVFGLPNVPAPATTSTFYFYFGCDLSGSGPYIAFRYNSGTTSWDMYDGVNGSWGNAGTETLRAAGAIPSAISADRLNIGLGLVPTDTTNTNYNINVSLTHTSTHILLETYTLSGVTTSGGYIGFADTVNSGTDFSSYIGPITLQSVQNLPDILATNYVYTFVNEFGEEGPPSPASADAFVSKYLSNTLTGFDTFFTRPSTGLEDDTYSDPSLSFINIYRANTGSTATQYQFLVSLPLGTTTYTDTTPSSSLGEVLQTTLYDLPPEDGINLINLANGITMMSSKNQICPSAQYLPYTYPESYRLATDFPVVGMGSVETSAIVLTRDSAYLVVGSDPSAMSMSKISSVYGCVAKRSITRWAEYGIAYASLNGLVVINPGGASLITEEYITKKEWQLLNPATIIGEIHEDTYYGTYTAVGGGRGSFLFDPRDQGIGFIDLGVNWDASFVDHLEDSLYLSISGILKKWNYSNTPLTYQWRSKVFQLPYPTAMNAAQIRGVNANALVGTTTFKIYKDREVTPYYTKTVTNDTEFVLPSIIAKELQLEVTGTARINIVQVAEDMVELE